MKCVPADLCLSRRADKEAIPLIRKMHSLLFKRCGIRVITLCAYIDQKETLGINLYVPSSANYIPFVNIVQSLDFNRELGEQKLKSFEDMYPAEVADLMQAWWGYSAYATGVDSGSIPSEMNRRRQRKATFEACFDIKDGFPIFKPLKADQVERLTDRKDKVRTFLNLNYGESAHHTVDDSETNDQKLLQSVVQLPPLHSRQ